MTEEFHLHAVPTEEQPESSPSLHLEGVALFLLRLVSGLIFAIHGAQLLFGLLGGRAGLVQRRAPFTLLGSPAFWNSLADYWSPRDFLHAPSLSFSQAKWRLRISGFTSRPAGTRH